ncbi:MAG: DcaP family trimeric outer membrane transporter [Rikenellaceae bacterium]
MKAIRLLIVATLITSAATARSYDSRDYRRAARNEAEVVLIVDDNESEPEIYEFENPEEAKIKLRERADCKLKCKEIASMQLTEVVPTGFSSAKSPSLVFTQKENKFSFGIGGFINFRTSYDFNGTVENIDFVTADIPIPGTYASHQQIMMDASTSRVFLAGVVNSRALGAVEIYFDMDFRGNTGYNGSGITNSYTPRVRDAYAKFLGITVGRTVTTFCDLHSAPETVDFQGPSAYPFNFATMIRYEHTFCDDRLTAAIALEQPSLSATYGSTYEAIPQRVPDLPVYLQYSFGTKRDNHFRASAVFRDMYAYDATDDENTALFGWGVQASGRVTPFEWMGLCFNGIYGKGISRYIQDLNGLGLDFTPNPEDTSNIQTMPMYAWQAAMNLNLTHRLTMNGGYSRVVVEKENGYYSDDQYRKSEYIFGNLFYSVTPRMVIACEYLYGQRINMNCLSNSANRVSLMTQLSF